MFDSAHVQSVQRLDEFRAAIAQFAAESQDALSSLAMDCQRARDWLVDQKRFWDKCVRESYDEVVHAKAELARREAVPAGDRVPDTSQQEEDLRRAKAKLAFAEERVESCRRWGVALERAIEEFDGPVRHFGTRVEIELPKAVAALERLIRRLEAYVASAPPPAPRDA